MDESLNVFVQLVQPMVANNHQPVILIGVGGSDGNGNVTRVSVSSLYQNKHTVTALAQALIGESDSSVSLDDLIEFLGVNNATQ